MSDNKNNVNNLVGSIVNKKTLDLLHSTHPYYTKQRQAYEASKRDQVISKFCFIECVKKLGIPHLYLDIGCGPGHLVKACFDLQKAYSEDTESWGIDLFCENNTHYEALSNGIEKMRVTIQSDFLIDLFDTHLPNYTFDMMTCWEVMEHLPTGLEHNFINMVERYLKLDGYLLFCSATPGQGGHGHVNERSHGYWIRALTVNKKLIYEEKLTVSIRELIGKVSGHAFWYPKNMLVFKRV